MILALAVIAFFPYGVKCICGEGMIFAAFGAFMDATVAKAPAWARKPLWTCERCMCLWYGVPAAYGVLYGPWWVMWTLVVVAAVGVQDFFDA